MTDDQLWDANDVAVFLKKSRSWVYREARAGRIPCIRVGANIRFIPDELRRWVRAQGNRVVPFIPSTTTRS